VIAHTLRSPGYLCTRSERVHLETTRDEWTGAALPRHDWPLGPPWRGHRSIVGSKRCLPVVKELCTPSARQCALSSGFSNDVQPASDGRWQSPRRPRIAQRLCFPCGSLPIRRTVGPNRCPRGSQRGQQWQTGKLAVPALLPMTLQQVCNRDQGAAPRSRADTRRRCAAGARRVRFYASASGLRL
jgi:hypothetical protein